MGLSKGNNKSELEIIMQGFLVEKKPKVRQSDNQELPRQNVEVNKYCQKAWNKQVFRGERADGFEGTAGDLAKVAYGQ